MYCIRAVGCWKPQPQTGARRRPAAANRRARRIQASTATPVSTANIAIVAVNEASNWRQRGVHLRQRQVSHRADNAGQEAHHPRRGGADRDAAQR